MFYRSFTKLCWEFPPTMARFLLNLWGSIPAWKSPKFISHGVFIASTGSESCVILLYVVLHVQHEILPYVACCSNGAQPSLFSQHCEEWSALYENLSQIDLIVRCTTLYIDLFKSSMDLHVSGAKRAHRMIRCRGGKCILWEFDSTMYNFVHRSVQIEHGSAC